MLVLQGLLDGILSGGYYALMATGLTLVFGVMGIVNFAQGIMVVLGAYLSYELASKAGVDPFVGLLVTFPVMFLLGYVIYWLLIRPIKRDTIIISLLTLFAVGTMIEGVLNLVFSSDLVQIQAPYVTSAVHIGRIILPTIYLYAFGMSVVLLGALYFMLYRTRFGAALRAATDNPTAARLVGIEIHRVSAATMGLGVGLAAVGGMVFGATNAFNAASSYDLISRLLVIVLLGGLGSIGGALVASVAMLVINDLVSVIWAPVWGQITFYALLIVVLLIRPQGLFGRREVRSA